MSTYVRVLEDLCQQVKKNMSNCADDDIKWDPGVEILLLCAMMGHKPVGANRFFMMASIHDKFSHYMNKQISSKAIWNHLNTMYDLAALNELDVLPFPNKEVEFELPPEEFDEIALQRLGVIPGRETASTSTSEKTPSFKTPLPRTPKAKSSAKVKSGSGKSSKDTKSDGEKRKHSKVGESSKSKPSKRQKM